MKNIYVTFQDEKFNSSIYHALAKLIHVPAFHVASDEKRKAAIIMIVSSMVAADNILNGKPVTNIESNLSKLDVTSVKPNTQRVVRLVANTETKQIKSFS